MNCEIEPAVINTDKVAGVSTRGRLFYYCYLLRTGKKVKVRTKLRHLEPHYVLIKPIKSQSLEGDNVSPIETWLLIQLIGPVQMLNYCCQATRYLYGFNEHTTSVNTTNVSKDIRLDWTNLTTQSIDSCGTRIIDDAFSYIRVGESHLQISVHIADVTAFTRYSSTDWLNLANQTNTLYNPDRVINLIPEPSRFSLSPNLKREAISVTFDINIETGQLHELNEPVFNLTLIRNNKSFTFDNYILPSVLNRLLTNIRSKEIKGEIKEIDSFNLVRWMSTTVNRLVARYFKQIDHPTVWRCRNKKMVESGADKSDSIPEWVTNMEHTWYKYAKYSDLDTDSDIYTHFTSPIHRLNDQVVHLLLKDSLGLHSWNFTLDPSNIIDIINERTRCYKRLKYDLELAQMADELKETETELELDVYLINIVHNQARVYSPKLKKIIAPLLYHNKLNNKKVIETTDRDTGWLISDGKKHFDLHYGQELKLVISPHTSAWLASRKLWSVFPIIHNFYDS